MTPVDQTAFYDPANNGHGNCLQAALASVFDLPLCVVPNFVEHPQDEWLQNLFTWLKWAGRDMEFWDGKMRPAGYSIMNGPSPRGVRHSVVALDGAMIHDPHPSRAGLVSIDQFWTFVPWQEA